MADGGGGVTVGVAVHTPLLDIHVAVVVVAKFTVSLSCH